MVQTIVSLLAGLAAAAAFHHTVAVRLGWSDWVVFLVILVDVALVFWVPWSWHQYTAHFRLAQKPLYRRWYGARGLSESIGCGTLGMILFVIAPAIVFAWLAFLLVK